MGPSRSNRSGAARSWRAVRRDRAETLQRVLLPEEHLLAAYDVFGAWGAAALVTRLALGCALVAVIALLPPVWLFVTAVYGFFALALGSVILRRPRCLALTERRLLLVRIDLLDRTRDVRFESKRATTRVVWRQPPAWRGWRTEPVFSWSPGCLVWNEHGDRADVWTSGGRGRIEDAISGWLAGPPE